MLCLKIAATGAILALVVGIIIHAIGPYPGIRYGLPLIFLFYLGVSVLVFGLIAAIWWKQ